METKNLVMTVVSIAIAVIITAGVLMPVLSDATKTEDTFENVGYYDMTYTETNNLVFVWDHTAPNQVTINDEVISLPTADTTYKTIICGDNWVVRYGYDTTNKEFVQFYGSSGQAVYASVGTEVDMTVTCNSGSVSVLTTADPPASFLTTYTHLYVVDSNGDFVMKSKDVPCYLNGDSQILAIGLSRIGTIPNMGITIQGSIDDGFTWDLFRGLDVTFTDENADYTEVSGYVDLYKLDKLTATATNSSGSSDLTFNYFIVPAKVTAERAVHLDLEQIAIMSVIPLLVIIAILLMAVQIIVKNRE